MTRFRFARHALWIGVMTLAAVFILAPVTALAALPSANTTFTGTAKHNGSTAGTVSATVKSSRTTITAITFAKLSVCATSSISFTNVTVHSNGKFTADFNGVVVKGKFTNKHQATGTLTFTFCSSTKLTFTIYAAAKSELWSQSPLHSAAS